MARKRGRPSRYNRSLAVGIVDRMAKGESLRSICAPADMPAESTVRLWAAEDRDGFSARYAAATRARAAFWAEEMIDIADGIEGIGTVDVQRDRLRVDTRKWILARMLPNDYGDRVSHEVTGEAGGPIEITVTRKIVRAPHNRIAQHAGNGKSANGRAGH